jgi:hypothetical protein
MKPDETIKIAHKCHHEKCSRCQQWVHESEIPHSCPQKMPALPDPIPDHRIMYYDFESSIGGDGNHTVNCAIANWFEEDGTRREKICSNIQTFVEFLTETEMRDGVETARFGDWVIIAHNGSKYDCTFVVQELIRTKDVKNIECIYSGNGIATCRYHPFGKLKKRGSITFRDSCKHMSSPLSSWPEIFDLEGQRKGSFPYLYNTEENENVILKHKDIPTEVYATNCMHSITKTYTNTCCSPKKCEHCRVGIRDYKPVNPHPIKHCDACQWITRWQKTGSPNEDGSPRYDPEWFTTRRPFMDTEAQKQSDRFLEELSKDPSLFSLWAERILYCSDDVRILSDGWRGARQLAKETYKQPDSDYWLDPTAFDTLPQLTKTLWNLLDNADTSKPDTERLHVFSEINSQINQSREANLWLAYMEEQIGRPLQREQKFTVLYKGDTKPRIVHADGFDSASMSTTVVTTTHVVNVSHPGEDLRGTVRLSKTKQSKDGLHWKRKATR